MFKVLVVILLVVSEPVTASPSRHLLVMAAGLQMRKRYRAAGFGGA